MACRIAVLGLMVAHPMSAQWTNPVPLPTIGSEREDRARVGQLFGRRTMDDVMLRAASRSLTRVGDTLEVSNRILLPVLRSSYASALPYSANDGAVRAGRGINLALTGGVVFQRASLRVVIAPQILFEQNQDYQVVPFPQDSGTTRSLWSNPFHAGPESIDLPLRFGDRAHRRLDPGQSGITIRRGNLEFGGSTENLWWGPGIRNAIVLSNNAAGFPHLLARSITPRSTRFGLVSFDAVLGRLQESEYFDPDESRDGRTLAGGAITWRRDSTASLWLGASRLRLSGPAGSDPLSSVFARWVFAPAGFELYWEWARFEDPLSLRDFLEFPTHSQGYTYGLQWARGVDKARTVRLQTELSYLEPSASLQFRPVLTSYTSRTVPQGFTQLGKTLGAAIGPGSSSQFVGGDLLGASSRLGLFAMRIRHDNAALFNPQVPEVRAPDVSLIGGVRAATMLRTVEVALEVIDEARLNYLFQGGYVGPEAAGGFRGVDIVNRVVSIVVSPRSRF